MIAAFLTNVAEETRHGDLVRTPLGLVESKLLLGRDRAWQVAAFDGAHSLFVVEADDFAALDGMADLVRLPGEQAKFSDLIASWEGQSLANLGRRALFDARCDALGVSRGSEIAETVRRMLVRLEPAAFDGMFEVSIPNVRQTITDNFNRAALGTDWEVTKGGWAINASTTARPTDNFAYNTMRRAEASFPADQYAQALCEVNSNGDGGVAVRQDSSGNCYFVLANSTTPTLWERVAGANNFLADYSESMSDDVGETIKLVVAGTALEVFHGGSSRVTDTDASLSTGKPGLFTDYSGSSGPPDTDDFECTDAEATIKKQMTLLGAG